MENLKKKITVILSVMQPTTAVTQDCASGC